MAPHEGSESRRMWIAVKTFSPAFAIDSQSPVNAIGAQTEGFGITD
jgi:hypothetical protein